jgi:hypothetical protein
MKELRDHTLTRLMAPIKLRVSDIVRLRREQSIDSDCLVYFASLADI